MDNFLNRGSELAIGHRLVIRNSRANILIESLCDGQNVRLIFVRIEGHAIQRFRWLPQNVIMGIQRLPDRPPKSI